MGKNNVSDDGGYDFFGLYECYRNGEKVNKNVLR